MQIGAQHVTRDGPLSAIAITDSGHHLRQGSGVHPEMGGTTVVLIAGEPGDSGNQWVGCQFSDRAGWQSVGADIDQPETGHRRTGGVGEVFAQ